MHTRTQTLSWLYRVELCHSVHASELNQHGSRTIFGDEHLQIQSEEEEKQAGGEPQHFLLRASLELF